MMQVTEDLRNEFKEILNKFKYEYYGDGNNSVGLCKRLILNERKQELFTVFGNQWYLHEMSWIIKNKRLPMNNKELSHACGKPKVNSSSICINPKHVNEETHEENMKRIGCHNDIRRFERKINRYKDGEEKIKTPGPIFVHNINETDQEKLTPTPQIRYNKSRNQRKKERKQRLRYKREHNGKTYKAPKRKRTPYVCNCEPPCFINYNKWNSETRISEYTPKQKRRRVR